MIYRVLADAVVIIHLTYIAFVVVGAILAWRWRWLLWLHVPAVAWAIAIVTFHRNCFLTPLEKDLRHRAGAAGYPGGFVDHYLTGIIYPHHYLGLVQTLVAVLVAVGYVGLFVRAYRPFRR